LQVVEFFYMKKYMMNLLKEWYKPPQKLKLVIHLKKELNKDLRLMKSNSKVYLNILKLEKVKVLKWKLEVEDMEIKDTLYNLLFSQMLQTI